MDRTTIFKSPTYGKIALEQCVRTINQFMCADPHSEYEIAIGTDSQQHGKLSRVVSVIAARRIGKGGIYFTRDNKVPAFYKQIDSKIYFETQMSLELAEAFNELAYEQNILCDLSIHIDIGREGETKRFIKEISGWVTSLGYACEIKPNSYIAQTVANKHTKVGFRGNYNYSQGA